MKSLKLKKREGALVSSVVKDGPADKAGIKNGDVIISFDGKKIRDYNDLPIKVSTTPIGKKCEIVIMREGSEKKFSVKLEELKDGGSIEMVEPEESPIGISVEDLSREKAGELGLPEDAKGVLVKEISPDSPAAEKGLKVNDLIVEINRRKIRNVKDFKEITRRMKKKDDVLMLIKRGSIATIYIAFTI